MFNRKVYKLQIVFRYFVYTSLVRSSNLEHFLFRDDATLENFSSTCFQSLNFKLIIAMISLLKNFLVKIDETKFFLEL